ncbi:MAG: CTP synthase, partial [Bacteroidota bacterium]
ANSTEFKKTKNNVIDLMVDQKNVKNMGGTMRLGAYPCVLTKGSVAHAAYGKELIFERHRHRFEVNNKFRGRLESKGMVLSGVSPDNRLVEIIELPSHRWFVAGQFHPELKSRAINPHPLFRDFVKAAKELTGESSD